MSYDREPKVIIRACARYDVQKIRRLAVEALDELGLRPSGRTLVKPNVVIAGPEFPNAYTRPEFMEGVLLALKDRAKPSMTELAVGERCGITMPTRYAFGAAGYYEMIDRVGGVGTYHFEEVPQVEVPLYHPERLRDSIFIPEPVVKADFFVNCPKFKAHPWTTVTFSMKNYIGIQDDPHRLIDHDHKLNEKVADLQYVVQPQFCAIDAITAGEGRMLTPMPFDLGLVIFGSNQVAFDAVCSRIIGLDPMEIDHIRFAYEQGFGPVDLDEIEISGDVTLEEAQERADGFKSGLIRIEDYFADTNIRAHAGPPPGGEKDYCWGGCPGALEEAIEILRQYDTACDDKMPPLHIVMGAYEGQIDAKDGERVIFIGDCASFHGDVAGKKVNIDSVYMDRLTKSPYEVSHEDIYMKMLKTGQLVIKSRNDVVTRMVGCPVSVAEQVLALVHYGGLKNPYFAPMNIVRFNLPYFSWRTRALLNRLQGRPYQIAGPVHRGDARPNQNLPADGAHAPLENKR